MPDPIRLSAVGAKGPPLAVSHAPTTRDERTVLGPEAEQAFQAWVTANGIEDLDHPDSHYDYRGYWLENAAPPHLKGDHFPDTFKQHGHPSFSQESHYSQGPADGGMWLPGKDAQGMEVLLRQARMAVSHERLDPRDYQPGGRLYQGPAQPTDLPHPTGYGR